MGYFNVIAPCYVPSGPAKGHYVNLPSQTIEVPDETAAPLVESGCLVAYPAGLQALDSAKAATDGLDSLAPGAGDAAKVGVELANRTMAYASERAATAAEAVAEQYRQLKEERDQSPADPIDDEPPTDPPPPRRPRSRKRAED